ncbi:hypothetical protein NEOLEDRAFT_1242047 [Neolentinus lepideus HHB14362 ss-1]|uniref:Uncharacterized protein n=1 Tax=Neolentinus lepideus HHB14362 ss-1 TaxID=1314782 RepID=A0A165SC30_9AGAM|nr:hypothetical protein NEOLEDRAFT_1242047 [Neolentinus lepideus HHB14362 ss-1]
MDTITIFDYVTKTKIPKLIENNTKSGPNTRSASYSYKDIRQVGHWDLTFETIVNDSFAFCLEREVEKRPTSTTKPYINNERTTEMRLESVFWPHVRRVLDASFQPNVPRGHVKIFCDVGSSCRRDPRSEPDRAARVSAKIPMEFRLNRLPGEVKVSWKWSSDMTQTEFRNYEANMEFKQVLSQLLFYMKAHMCRWGYIITDKELVCARRQTGQDNRIEISEAIPLTRHKQPLQNWRLGPRVKNCYPEAQGELTALLAIWYLHMLASRECLSDGWFLGWGPRPGPTQNIVTPDKSVKVNTGGLAKRKATPKPITADSSKRKTAGTSGVTTRSRAKESEKTSIPAKRKRKTA